VVSESIFIVRGRTHQPLALQVCEELRLCASGHLRTKKHWIQRAVHKGKGAPEPFDMSQGQRLSKLTWAQGQSR